MRRASNSCRQFQAHRQALFRDSRRPCSPVISTVVSLQATFQHYRHGQQPNTDSFNNFRDLSGLPGGGLLHHEALFQRPFPARTAGYAVAYPVDYTPHKDDCRAGTSMTVAYLTPDFRNNPACLASTHNRADSPSSPRSRIRTSSVRDS